MNTTLDTTSTTSATSTLSSQQALATALRIADQLVSDALWSGNACTFAGSHAPSAIGETAPYGTVEAGVYDGAAGVARFLYQADRYAPNRYRETAEAALRYALQTSSGFSLFSGSLGVGVVALQTGSSEFAPRAVALIDGAVREARSFGDDAPADLLAGLAGVVVALDAALSHSPNLSTYDRWFEAMVEFGTVLERAATRHFAGLSWPVYPGSEDHLCGLAHGGAGIAYAMQLLEQRASDCGPWQAVATGARDWERLHFSTEHGSWADLRSSDDPTGAGESHEPDCPHMWCHGSVGIAAERITVERTDRWAAMDRLAALEALTFSTEAMIAAPRGAGGSHLNNASQCHGLAGSIDVLIDAAQATGQADRFMPIAYEAGAAMCSDAEQSGRWRCGIPDAPETPGLMIGLAGIGWAMLRLAEPDQVPSAWRLGTWPSRSASY